MKEKDLPIAILSILIIIIVLTTILTCVEDINKEKAVFEITGKTIDQYKAEYNKLQNETKKQNQIKKNCFKVPEGL